jgi:hypothetical protein
VSAGFCYELHVSALLLGSGEQPAGPELETVCWGCLSVVQDRRQNNNSNFQFILLVDRPHSGSTALKCCRGWVNRA